MMRLMCCLALFAATMLAVPVCAEANLPIEASPVRHEAFVDLGSFPDDGWAFFTHDALFLDNATFELAHDRRALWLPYVSGTATRDTGGGVVLVAVRKDMLPKLRERTEALSAGPADKRLTTARAFEQASHQLLRDGVDWMATSHRRLGGRSNPADAEDVVRSTRTHLKLTAIRDGKLVFIEESKRLFDMAGHDVTPAEVAETRSRRGLLYALLGGLGLLGLGFVIVRRGRSA